MASAPAPAAFKRPADPPQPGGPAKRAAPTPAQATTPKAAPGSPADAEELRREIAALKKQYQGREANLLIRLSRKEAEVQNLLSELQSLAPLLHPDSTNLTSKLLDPALLTLHVAMRAQLAEKDAKIARLTEELAAREFTPQGIVGKRLIGKLKAVQSENEELGKLVYGGRMEALEVELGLAKKIAAEAKQGLVDANSLIVDLDADLETLQPHLYNARAELRWYRRRFGPRSSLVADAGTQTEEPEPEPYYEGEGGYRYGSDGGEEYNRNEGEYRDARDGGEFRENEGTYHDAGEGEDEREGDEGEPDYEFGADGENAEGAPREDDDRADDMRDEERVQEAGDFRDDRQERASSEPRGESGEQQRSAEEARREEQDMQAEANQDEVFYDDGAGEEGAIEEALAEAEAEEGAYLDGE
ncbi:hypothetical protein DFJ74DRAFT_664934 [Hyaloraphidium curvatum]|nr:hypothetical protein DFJ74DRAFT_664934 [Hyaloraphidium curvatum]